MSYKKILTVQDISCVGQCSLTVALPIISACGVETCVLPSAVLSTHTGGFSGYTFRDLTEDMPAIKDHWVKEGIAFDAIYTGYLGSTKQIDYVADIFESVAKDGCVKIVDPAMADNGKLYYGFDEEFVEAMKGLCAKADYVLPNITEACFLTGMEYKTEYDREYIDTLLAKLVEIGCKNVVFTGISYREGKTGVVVLENGEYYYYEHEKLANSCHGTGDSYASAFVGALMRGKDAKEASRIAADFTLECIRETAKLEGHWYGAAFELAIPKLIELLM
jgi:pyridoxine kinase